MREKHTSSSSLNLNRRQMLSTAGLGVAGLSIPAIVSACTNSSTTTTTPTGSGSTVGNFPSHPQYKFVFINHVTTNAFFTPTRYGFEDAAAALGCATPQWTGSEKSIISDMVNAFNTAISAKVDGIAIPLIDANAFNDPTAQAIAAGIPVVSYNADVPAGSPNQRLAYIGQDLFASGVEVGNRIVSLVPSGDIVGFIATPGSGNLQPRIDGIKQAIKDSGKPINFTQIATGATIDVELPAVDAYYSGHTNLKGMVAVDGGSTQSVAQVMEKYSLASKGIHAGGYDLQPKTLQEIKSGNLDFTIDQQPYLQGFLPVVQLFLYKISGGLSQPSPTNTGLLFVTKDNVDKYIGAQSRFEGSTDKQKILS